MGAIGSEPENASGALARDRAHARSVGRARETGILLEQLRRTLAGEGRLALVSGEAGIGKTTLLDDLTHAAESQGCLVLWGHAYDLSVTPPYGPWLEVLRQAPATGQLPLLPTLVRDAPSPAVVGSQDALFASFAACFEECALRQPLVLVLDDLHWADQGSLDFLRFLARQSRAQRLLIVATYRSEELLPEHPLHAVLPLLIREADAARLEVRRLDAEGQRTLITSRYTLRAEDAERLELYLQAHAEGNPLFALELLRNLEEESILQQSDGSWSLGDTTHVRVPPLLRQVIERRLERLGDDARALLQVAAIIGQEAPLDLWQRVTQASDEALATAIEQGQATHLLHETPGGVSYRFQHALLRAALYEGVVAPRRRGWHRQVAEALAAQPQPAPDAVAHHFQQAGDVRAVAWLLESARRARMTYATTTALERLEIALALDEQQAGASGLRGWVLAARASWGGPILARLHDSLQMFDEALALATHTSDAALAAFVQWSRAFLEVFLYAPVDVLSRAGEQIQNLPDSERARLFGFIYGDTGAVIHLDGPELACTIVGVQGHAGQARATLVAVERIRAAYPAVSDAAELSIGNGLFACYQGLGRPDEALQVYERILASYRRDFLTDWAANLSLLELRDLVLVYWADRLALRQALVDEAAARRSANLQRGRSSVTPNDIELVALFLVDGRWDAARQALERAAAAERWALGITAADWMTLLRHQGQPDAALERLPIVFPAGPASEPGRITFDSACWCMHVAIEIALDAGDLATARAWLACHDRWMEWSGHIPYTTLGHLLWGRCQRVAGEHAAAVERANQALALATRPRQPLAQLAAHRLLGELDAESGMYERAQQHFKQALRLAAACEAPFERALTLVAMAQAAIASGDNDAARPWLIEARAICAPLGAMPTLERIAALEARLAVAPKPQYPAGLSAREVEVLRLVADGLTDADVAERLFLARRTVNTHLTSIYTKLGVSSRAAATRYAVEHGLT